MQHFPLFRRSDEICEEMGDLAPPLIRTKKFHAGAECLSNESTQFLLQRLRPRAAFGGHTHYGCKRWWDIHNFWEYSVPSFSWRNNRRPSFLLLSVSPNRLTLSNCFLPDEHIIIALYVLALLFWLYVPLYITVKKCRQYRHRRILGKPIPVKLNVE